MTSCPHSTTSIWSCISYPLGNPLSSKVDLPKSRKQSCPWTLAYTAGLCVKCWLIVQELADAAGDISNCMPVVGVHATDLLQITPKLLNQGQQQLLTKSRWILGEDRFRLQLLTEPGHHAYIFQPKHLMEGFLISAPPPQVGAPLPKEGASRCSQGGHHRKHVPWKASSGCVVRVEQLRLHPACKMMPYLWGSLASEEFKPRHSSLPLISDEVRQLQGGVMLCLEVCKT